MFPSPPNSNPFTVQSPKMEFVVAVDIYFVTLDDVTNQPTGFSLIEHSISTPTDAFQMHFVELRVVFDET